MNQPDLAHSPRERAPLFTIVTIGFNDRDGIRAVWDSLGAQTWTDYEWVVVDGGSSDGTVGLLEGIGDPRLSFTSEPDTGIYNAMNKGAAAASGKYVIFMNSGDTFASADELGKAAADLAGGDVDLLYGDAIEVDRGSEHMKIARSCSSYWYSMFTHHQAMYYRTDLFRTRRYDESFRLAADWALTADILREGARAKYVNRPICRFQRGGASFSSSRPLANREALRVYRHHARLPRLAAETVWLAKLAVNALRSRLPGVYDRLRMRHSTDSNQRSSS